LLNANSASIIFEIKGMIKEKRQQTIRNFIQAQNVGTQDELTELLSKAGFSVTQSSVSRDLDELGIIKANGFYAIPRKEKNENFGLQTLETAGENLIVARCEAGLASAACVKIDREKFEGIVGTIAGDDTIFIAIRNHKEQKAVLKKVWEIFEK
jgi:transcriptional regulator of arginine metabolism